ncbi:TerD family protein [Histomonas meleagridis]|uniref:TerD family protein n=1 Tax=Histomonas meleagridis TaxID=135588 RepID=UPI00355A629B|nr:TerD family protein [Histomonas meleagridis]KAH0803077.1 TerD family protein [Histomonas meleagridis]
MIDVWISSAENLPSADPNGLSDPFTKIQSKAFGLKYKLAKTEIKFKTLDPVWDGDYSKPLKVPFVCVDNLDFELYDYDRLSSNDYLGTVDAFLSVENNDKELKLPVTVKKATKGPPTLSFKYRLPTENFPSDSNIKNYTAIYAYLTYSSPVTGTCPVQLSAMFYENTKNLIQLVPPSNNQKSLYIASASSAHYGPTGYTNVYKFMIKNMKKSNGVFVFFAKSMNYEGDVTLHFVAADEVQKKNRIKIKNINSFKILKSCNTTIANNTCTTFPITISVKKGVITYENMNVMSLPDDKIDELFGNVGRSIDATKPFWRRLTLYQGTTVSLSSAVDFHHVQFPSSIAVGLGWDTTTDLDGSCLVYSKAKFNDKFEYLDCCFFNSLKVLNGLIYHSGDNLTGQGEGDDEVITIKLQDLPREVRLLAITVTSYGGVPFNRISGGFLRLMDGKNKFELMYLPLTNQQAKTGLIFAILVRTEDEIWELVPCLRYIDAQGPRAANTEVLRIINDKSQFEELLNFRQQ